MVLSRSLLGEQGLPECPLFFPVRDPRQRLEVPQVNRVAAVLGPRQEQERFLNIGGQQEQVQDLGHAGAGHVPEVGQGGIVGDHAASPKSETRSAGRSS
jgi:hypothetical protein